MKVISGRDLQTCESFRRHLQDTQCRCRLDTTEAENRSSVKCFHIDCCLGLLKQLTRLSRAQELCWKSRWPSWAPVPNKPTVSVDVKQHFKINQTFAQCLHVTVHLPTPAPPPPHPPSATQHLSAVSGVVPGLEVWHISVPTTQIRRTAPLDRNLTLTHCTQSADY